MHILFVSMEVAPFSKVGGLGDVAQALPQALAAQGVQVTVLSPWYKTLPANDARFKQVKVIRQGWLPLGQSLLPIRWLEPEEQPAGLRLVFLEEPVYLSHEHPYDSQGNPNQTVRDPQASVLFSKGVVDWVAHLPGEPWVVHLNEHHSAPAALLLRHHLPQPPTLLTVHNFSHHGLYDPAVLHLLGPGLEGFSPGGPLEFYGQVNFLKIGLWYADALTTVSPTYRQEAMGQYEFGLGLEGVLQNRQAHLAGILNGIDVTAWNPTTSPHLAHPYSAAKLAGKAKNKQALLAELELPETLATKPLCIMISRLVDQKGVDLLLEVAPRLFEAGAAMVVLGTGAPHYEQALERLQQDYPQQCRALMRYDEAIAHRLLAGGDVFLMPSRFEPCGLTQMYALAFGTLPVVRHTGGLADTVQDVVRAPKQGNGFTFGPASAEAFWQALAAALALFAKPKRWQEVMARGMAQDFSWGVSAGQYVTLYQNLRARRNPLDGLRMTPPAAPLPVPPPLTRPTTVQPAAKPATKAASPVAKPAPRRKNLI